MRGAKDNLGKLPENWEWLKISDFAEVMGGKRLPKGHEYSVLPTDHAYIRVTDFDKMTVDTSDLRHLLYETHELIKKYIISKDDLYISIAGSIGKVGLIPDSLDGSNLTENAAKITNLKNVDKRFLCYFFNSNYAQEQIKDLIISTNQPKLALFRIEKIIAPIAPFPEQHRIVARIEELFSRLDAGVEALRRAKAQLQRYRQSVLKAAVEGRLTAEWRAAHPEVEAAEKLFGKIIQERKNYAKRLRDTISPDPLSLPEIPNNWTWATVEQLGPPDRTIAYGVLQPGPDVVDGVPLIRVGDIEGGKVRITNLKRISPKIAAEYERTRLMGGEVLITLVGAIGRTAVVPGILAEANTARAVGVIPLSNHLRPSWVEIWFRNPDKIYEMTSKAHEVARKTLNLEDVRSAPVAIPPQAEQDEIINEVESKLSLAENAEQIIDQSQRRCEKLRQSILTRAFQGRLIPQDPKDEPASILLERIRAGRAKASAQQGRGRSPKTNQASLIQ